MAEPRSPRLDQPAERRRQLVTRPRGLDSEAFGKLSEGFARFMGTPMFIFGMTVFVTLWLAWNTWGPADMQFDPRALNYTLLTLILSLQASYAAPLILLAQNRQADRDRVALEQDRSRDERNLADTEFLTREVAALRIAMRDNATRDFIRGELRDLLEELDDREAKTKAEAKRKAKAKASARAKAARAQDGSGEPGAQGGRSRPPGAAT